MSSKELFLSAQAEKTNGSYPGIRFEPGFHLKRPPLIWNAEVKKRMRSYNPEVIAVDGLQPSSIGLVDRDEILGYYLPGLPSEINTKSEEMFLVRGEVTSQNYYSDMYGPVIQLTGNDRDKFRETMRHVEDIDGRGKVDFGISLGIENLSITLAFIAFKELETRELQRASRVDRRAFLKLGAVATGGLLLARFGVSLGGPMAWDEVSRETVERIASIVRPIYADGAWWVDGRTALLIAKTQDSIDFLGKPKETAGSVVFGSSHEFQAEKLLKDGVLRENVIRKFGSNILLIVDNILGEYGGREDIKAEVHQAIVDSIEFTDIVRANTSSNDLTLVGSFKSQQVKKALE